MLQKSMRAIEIASAMILLFPVLAVSQGREDPLAQDPGREFYYYSEGFYRGYLDVIRKSTMDLPTSKMVSVIGKVVKPASFSAEPGLTALKAVELAGGFSEFADDRRVGVWKQKDGRFLIFNAKNPAKTPELEEGDIVVVLGRRIEF